MPNPRSPPPILRRVLEAAGYRIDVRPGLLRAVRSRDRRAIVVVQGPRSPIELEREFPPETVHRTIVYPDDPGDIIRGLASERAMEILDSSTLGPALGELLLLGPDVPGAGAVDAGDEPEILPPTMVLPGGERIVHPRLSRGDAEGIAGLDDARTTLRLIPFYVASYRVRTVSAHGGPGPSSDHVVAVNALSGRVEVWEPGEREIADRVDEPHQRLDPQRSEGECRALAEDALRRRHTVNVDHTEQHGGALVIERRKVPPSPGDLKVGPCALVRVPYWYIESVDGRIVLDAVTGNRSLPDERETVAYR